MTTTIATATTATATTATATTATTATATTATAITATVEARAHRRHAARAAHPSPGPQPTPES